MKLRFLVREGSTGFKTIWGGEDNKELDSRVLQFWTGGNWVDVPCVREGDVVRKGKEEMKTPMVDASWKDADRTISFDLQMSAIDHGDLIADLSELLEGLKAGEVPSRWYADNCPHSVSTSGGDGEFDPEGFEAFPGALSGGLG